MNKRILSSILLIAMLASTVISCGGTETAGDDTTASGGSSDTTTEAVVTEETDGIEDVDMEGFTLNVLHNDPNRMTWVNIELNADAENGETLNDAIFKRNQYIMERFNCNLNFHTVNNTADLVASSVLSGANEYDIMMGVGSVVIGNLDYIADFNNIPYVDLDKVYWNPNATGMYSIAGKQLAAAGNFTLSYSSGSSCFLFNKALYESLGHKEDLYQLARDGKWTVDKLFELGATAIRDLNGDAKLDPENDQYGISSYTPGSFYNALVLGSGYKYLRADEDGIPYLEVSQNESMVDFLQYLFDKTTVDDGLYGFTATGWAQGEKTLTIPNNNILFTEMFVSQITSLRDSEVDFGILPVPKKDEAQEQYYSRASAGELSFLPRDYSEDRIEYVGMLLEAMTYYSQKTLIPAYKETMLKTKLTRDDESSDMLDLVFAGITFDAGLVVWESQVGAVINKDVFYNKNNIIASTIEGMKSNMDTAIDTLVTAVEDMP